MGSKRGGKCSLSNKKEENPGNIFSSTFLLASFSLIGDHLRLKKQGGGNRNKKENMRRRKFDETFESEKTLLSIWNSYNVIFLIYNIELFFIFDNITNLEVNQQRNFKLKKDI